MYEKDFEEYLLTETGAFYRRKASEWIEQVGSLGSGSGCQGRDEGTA